MRGFTQNRKWFLGSALIVALDQLAKWCALTTLSPEASCPFAPLLNGTLVYNRGTVFGLFGQGELMQRIWLSAIALWVGLIVAYALTRLAPERKGMALAFMCILGGAVGNLIDRARLGYVIDFIDVHVGAWHWPVFNVADMAISVGIGLWVWLLVFGERKLRQPG